MAYWSDALECGSNIAKVQGNENVSGGATPENLHPTVLGRSCGTCTLCCKVLKILELNKPQGTWCQHCKPGTGCKIYAERPFECRAFHCGYLTQAELGEEWKPDRSKIILVVETEISKITAHVDPQRPDAWTREPFHTQLRRWAAAAAPHRGQVIATVGRHAFVIFPNRDADLGFVDEDELIVTTERNTPFGVELNASKIHKDDPRAQNLVLRTIMP